MVFPIAFAENVRAAPPVNLSKNFSEDVCDVVAKFLDKFFERCFGNFSKDVCEIFVKNFFMKISLIFEFWEDVPEPALTHYYSSSLKSSKLQK